jgi:hypothetical protein
MLTGQPISERSEGGDLSLKWQYAPYGREGRGIWLGGFLGLEPWVARSLPLRTFAILGGGGVEVGIFGEASATEFILEINLNYI